ncbi:MAG: DUF3298 domain-containing protein [Cyclobacteriaceae bacterium]
MRKLMLLLSTAAILVITGCSNDSENNSQEINQTTTTDKTTDAEPPTEPLNYTMVQKDTILGDCDDETAFPPCTHLSLSYPDGLSGSGSIVRDSISAMVRQYIFEGDSDGQFFSKYKPTPLDSLDDSYRDIPTSKWDIDNQISIEHNTTQLITVKYQTYQYTGGAHGNGSSVFFNLDPATGQAYELADFLEKPAYRDSLNAIAEQTFRKKYELGNQSLKSAGYWFQNNDFKLNDNFTITEEGLNFLFNAYEITSYAAGTPELFISWQSIEGIIDESSVPVSLSNE